MNINSLIKKERCFILKSTTKTEAFHEIFEYIESEGLISDTENVKKEIFYREQIMSTGIGQGLGIPHIRYEGITEPQILVGINPKGIEDYESLDKQPVKIIIMILVGADQHKEYLRILSLLVNRLKDESSINRILEAETPEEIKTAFIGSEQ
ncbi:PTS sugar transporter subunit IIA [Oceanispirochaeta crateris]|uniref:PTS sugar transporter subunit IIA n=1 Tax=Oceanispirochaeta crateris TaxID=2518645 RepID=A0A5C1QH40_9SPIO|nr:PTS sugar transporter subunit IIA [Oceanispirochaeta crateris]QEN06881.1 PTS sugar transporter subunit IIA [Oceanispirochaeta crateris]